MSRNTIIGIAALIIVALAAYFIIEEANEGPLEEAAGEMEDAAEDIADELD